MLPNSYRKYNADIEIPSFGSPQSKSTPLKKNTLPVDPANKVLFHTENEKRPSSIRKEKNQVQMKTVALVEKSENEEIKFDEPRIGKYWNFVTTIAEVHEIPKDCEPTPSIICVPNNAEQLGVSYEMQKVLNDVVNDILNESLDSDISSATSSPHLYIKSKEGHYNDESLIEAILFSSNERLCV